MNQDPSTRLASPLRRSLLGASAAAGALAALPAGATPRTLAERQWLAEPDTVAGPVTADFGSTEFRTTHGHIDLQLRQAVAGTAGRSALDYLVIDRFQPVADYQIPVNGFLAYRRADGSGWHRADHDADSSGLAFARQGDLVAVSTPSSNDNHFPLGGLGASDFNVDDGSSHAIALEPWPTGYAHAPLLIRRGGEVLVACRRNDFGSAVDAPVQFLRRDARGRVWSVAPSGLTSRVTPLRLFEDPCGALILVAPSASGTGAVWFRQASAGAAWVGPTPVPLPANFPPPTDFNTTPELVAMDERGAFHLLWIVPGPPDNITRRTLRHAQITPDGSTLRPSRTLAIGNVFAPRLQLLAGGQVALMWKLVNGDSQLAFLLPDGKLYAAPSTRGDIVLDRFGNALAVWSDDAAGTALDDPRYFTEDYLPSHIWARTRLRGQPWQAPVRIDGSGTGPRRRVGPVAAMAADGSAIVGWIAATLGTDPTLPQPGERRWVERRVEAQVFA